MAGISQKLTKAERETVITYDEESRQFLITTVCRRHITRLTKALKRKGEVLDRFGTQRWVCDRLPVLRG